MAERSVARYAHDPPTRAERGLALFRERGGENRHLYGNTYRVPSRDGQRAYGVEYGPREYCSCSDHRYRDETCIHLYALGIATAKGVIVHPELAAGDPFVAAARARPCACIRGWVYLGVEEDGVERDVAVRCRRCNA